MNVYFLEAKQDLTKTIDYNTMTKTYIKTSYPLVKNFTSFREQITTSQELCNVLQKHATAGRCMIKGQLDQRLVNEPRKGHTSATQDTEILVLDLDNEVGVNSPEGFIKRFFPALSNCSYVLQYSASHVISSHPRFHLFFLIEPTNPNKLKLWLKSINIEHKLITQLSSDGHSPLYPIDITVNQNDKLIYIAPPRLTPNVPNQNTGFQYIQHVQKRDDRASLPNFVPLEAIETVNALRQAKGLPKKQPKYATQGSTSYMSNPEIATVTGEKKDGTYTRLNLNDETSWAWWHFTDQPYYLYTFRDQDAIYRIQDIVPKYWAKLKKQKPTRLPEHIAFRDLKTDTLYSGSVDDGFYEIASTNLPGWCNHVGIPPMSAANVPTFDYKFDPHRPIFDPTPKYPVLNKYIPPNFPQEEGDFPEIERIVKHVVNNDDKTYKKLINWLACVVQTKDKLLTTWLLHGTEGTGKGLLFHNIMTPILGSNYTQIKTVENIDERFDAWKEHTLLVLLDEFNSKHATPQTADKLKYLITEKYQNTRKMRQDNAIARNYMNIIIASNDLSAVAIKDTDRRIHVAPRQEVRLNDPDMEKIEAELKHFCYHLHSIEIDIKDAQTVETNAEKAKLIENNKTTVTQFFDALQKGDLAYFSESMNIPTQHRFLEKAAYEKVIHRWVDEYHKQRGTSAKVAIHELQDVYTYIVNPEAAKMTHTKFKKMMEKDNPKLKIERFRINNQRVLGVHTKFYISAEDLAAIPNVKTIVPVNSSDRQQAS